MLTNYESAKDRFARTYVAEKQEKASWSNLIQGLHFNMLQTSDTLYLTPLRLVIVFDMLRVWGTNNDNYRTDSHYHQYIHDRAPTAPFTTPELILGFGALLSMAYAAGNELYTRSAKAYRHSEAFLMDKIDQTRQAYFPQASPRPEEKRNHVRALKTAINEKRWNTLQKQLRNGLIVPTEAITNEVQQDIDTDGIVSTFSQDLPWYLSLLNQIKDFVGNLSYTFWVTWMTVACFYSVPYVNTIGLPAVTLASVGIGGAVALFSYLFQPKKPNPEKLHREQTNDDRLYQKIESEEALHVFLKNRHHLFKERMKLILQHASNNVKAQFPKLYKKPGSVLSNEDAYPSVTPATDRDDTEGSKLREILSYTSMQAIKKTLLNIAHKTIGEFTAVFFALWIIFAVAATTAALFSFTATLPIITPILASIAGSSATASFVFSGIVTAANMLIGLVSTPAFSVSLAVLAGGLGALFTYADQRLQLLKHQKTLDKALVVPYKTDRFNRADNRVSKEIIFNNLYAQVEQKKAVVAALQNAIATYGVANQSNTVKEAMRLIAEYDLKAIEITKDPLDDRTPSSEFFSRSFAFINSAGAWVFNLRNMGLPTGAGYAVSLIASIGSSFFLPIGGTVALFGILAATLGLAGGSLRLALIDAENLHEQRTGFLNQLDMKIHSLRQSNIELDYLIKLHNESENLMGGKNNIAYARSSVSRKNGVSAHPSNPLRAHSVFADGDNNTAGLSSNQQGPSETLRKRR